MVNTHTHTHTQLNTLICGELYCFLLLYFVPDKHDGIVFCTPRAWMNKAHQCTIFVLCTPHLNQCEYTHTHTHTYLYRPSTVDFFLQEFYTQPWTYTSEFSRITMDFLCVCVCVRVCVSINYLTMDYPPTPTQVHVWNFFWHACLCDLLPIEGQGSLTIVDVHGWCVSTVSFWFVLCLSTIEGIYKLTHTHTHIRTHTFPFYTFEW